MTGYVLNCFLLVVPVLLLNLVFARHLLPGYQPSQWNDVPAAVTVPENALRILVMALPLLLLTFHNVHAAIAYRKTSGSPRSLAS
jgi:hypothetical protein